MILFDTSVKERAAETGELRGTLSFHANLFEVSGMASFLPPEPQPTMPKLDKCILPPPMRQTIVDLYAAYPAHRADEIARVMCIPSGWKAASASSSPRADGIKRPFWHRSVCADILRSSRTTDQLDEQCRAVSGWGDGPDDATDSIRHR